MAGRRATRSYTIQPFQVGSDQSEIDLLIINFLADSLAAAEAQAMIYVSNGAFGEDIDGLKLLHNDVEVWRWLKGEGTRAEGDGEIVSAA